MIKSNTYSQNLKEKVLLLEVQFGIKKNILLNEIIKLVHCNEIKNKIKYCKISNQRKLLYFRVIKRIIL